MLLSRCIWRLARNVFRRAGPAIRQYVLSTYHTPYANSLDTRNDGRRGRAHRTTYRQPLPRTSRVGATCGRYVLKRFAGEYSYCRISTRDCTRGKGRVADGSAGVAGIPGSGKSTVAYPLTDRVNELLRGESTTHAVAVCVPVDGWHYSLEELRAMPVSQRTKCDRTVGGITLRTVGQCSYACSARSPFHLRRRVFPAFRHLTFVNRFVNRVPNLLTRREGPGGGRTRNARE